MYLQANEQATKRRKLFSFLEKSDEKDCKPNSALLIEFNDFVREQLILEYECPFRYTPPDFINYLTKPHKRAQLSRILFFDSFYFYINSLIVNVLYYLCDMRYSL